MKRGVLVAADKNLEWLLPWWWERYSCCNTLPVAFADLGMTQEARNWCEERGKLFVVKEPIIQEVKGPKEWEDVYGQSYYQARKAWFKKPLACFHSPFEETVWIDLDCEILSSIDCIFSYLREGKEIAIALDRIAKIPDGFSPEKEEEKKQIFNSGVVVFSKKSGVIQAWVDKSLHESHLYWGDDYVLSVILHAMEEKVEVLPPIYNWRLADGIPFYAKIVHWCGEWGKACIAKQGGLKKILEQLPGLKKAFGI